MEFSYKIWVGNLIDTIITTIITHTVYKLVGNYTSLTFFSVFFIFLHFVLIIYLLFLTGGSGMPVVTYLFYLLLSLIYYSSIKFFLAGFNSFLWTFSFFSFLNDTTLKYILMRFAQTLFVIMK